LGAPIEKGEIQRLLIEACPSFAGSDELREFVESGFDDLPYLLAGAFIRHLVTLNVQGRREEFGAVFDLFERLHTEGDPYVLNLATVGFLEDLGNGNMHRGGSKPSDFEKYLRPKSRWWWEELELLWAGKIPYLGGSGRPRPKASG
jgi:hypothetical protein